MRIAGLRMSKYYFLILSSFLLVTSNLSYSLSLGRIITNSMYGEPLDADILLEDTNVDLKQSQIKVKLADDIQFKKVGLRKLPFHNELTFKPYSDSNHNWYIKVTSPKPISTQFLSFLVTVDWPQGQATREYITIMKNPTFEQPKSATQNNIDSNFSLASTQESQQIVRDGVGTIRSDQTDQTDQKEQTDELYKDYQDNDIINSILEKPAQSMPLVKPIEQSKPTTSVETELVTPLPNNIVVYKAPSGTTTVTVPGDTLSEIAEGATSADTAPGLTRQQMMVAIYNTNKSAFVNGDKHRLRGNVTLNIPSIEQARQIYAQSEQSRFQATAIAKTDTTITASNKADLTGSYPVNIADDINNKTVTKAVTKAVTKSIAKPVVAAKKITRTVTKPVVTAKAKNATRARTLSKQAVPVVAKSKTVSKSVTRSVIAQRKTVKPMAGAPAPSEAVVTAQTSQTPDVIRIAPVDDNFTRLLVVDASETAAPAAQTETRLNNNLSQLTPIKEDIMKSNKQLNQNTPTLSVNNANTAPKRLEIVNAQSEGNTNSNMTNNYLLNAEALVARQKEIQELKDQLIIIKAQLKDMERLVAMRNNEPLPALAPAQAAQSNTATSTVAPAIPVLAPRATTTHIATTQTP
ncbi:MAG: hypothetical protein KBD64_04735, partial [Gammaproteobacteria bacterium]|nr:hypothetical protein [Gammaproteobacteria bacterium]